MGYEQPFGGAVQAATPSEQETLAQLASAKLGYETACGHPARYLTCSKNHPFPGGLAGAPTILGLTVVHDDRCPTNQLVITHKPVTPEDVFPAVNDETRLNAAGKSTDEINRFYAERFKGTPSKIGVGYDPERREVVIGAGGENYGLTAEQAVQVAETLIACARKASDKPLTIDFGKTL